MQVGFCRWIASYSGDLNNNAAGPTACADAAEAVVVTKASPALSTTASGSVVAGGAVKDVAHPTLGTNPTGTNTFTHPESDGDGKNVDLRGRRNTEKQNA